MKINDSRKVKIKTQRKHLCGTNS